MGSEVGVSIKYPCPLSKSGTCKYGGNKNYDYGFVRGTDSYCRKVKRWVSALKECPIEKAFMNGEEMDCPFDHQHYIDMGMTYCPHCLDKFGREK